MLSEAKKRFVFYDTETSGLSAEFDQIFQFAAVVTDEDFNEIESLNIRCRRHPHIVPALGALVTTGIDPFTLEKANMSNYEMAALLTQKFSEWTPSTFIGYNTIRFDEPFLRHLFYKNLQPIYQTQTSSNGRLDCMKLVDATLNIDPTILAFEMTGRGAPNRKLESLAQLNGFKGHDAHDALGDVRATIFIANHIKQRRPDIWLDYLASRSKHLFEDAIYQKDLFLITESATKIRLGSAINPVEDNQGLLCFDHIFTSNSLPRSLDEWLHEYKRKKPSPFFRIKTNAATFVKPVGIEEASKLYPYLDLANSLELFQKVHKSPDFISQLKSVEMGNRTEYPKSDNVEQKIYDGFPTSTDQSLMAEFHRAPPQDKLLVLGKIEDARFRSLGMRLVAENWPELLSTKKYDEHKAWVAKRLISDDAGNYLSAEIKRGQESLLNASAGNSTFIQTCLDFYNHLTPEEAVYLDE
jgi:exodeoxyribonuclease-1